MIKNSLRSSERGSSEWIDRLEQAVATGACFGRSDFATEDLRAARLPNIDLRGSRLSSARLDGADLVGACFRAADLSHASLVGADLRRTGLREAILVGADLRNADLREANLLDADLTGALLDGARIDGVAFNAASLHSADLRGARFGDVRLFGRRPLLQISGIGRSGATLTAYRAIDRCMIAMAGIVCQEGELAAALTCSPHLCAPDEAEAVTGLIRAHRNRAT